LLSECLRLMLRFDVDTYARQASFPCGVVLPWSAGMLQLPDGNARGPAASRERILYNADHPMAESPLNASSPRACQICGSTQRNTLHPAALVRPALAELIRSRAGSWSESGWICNDDLHQFRHALVESILTAERGELSALDREVLDSMRQQEVLARNPEDELHTAYTFGQRVADRIAAVGGSWRFIISFMIVLAAWIGFNSFVLVTRAFDPFPYILLNLVLSCLASIQAPVIMMSQNRQETRDRLHAQRDYQVNLKAELEIRQLHQKIDHLLSHQWERLVEIQDIQMELMNELRSPGKRRGDG
jgi:uncharacterized membrane protein